MKAFTESIDYWTQHINYLHSDVKDATNKPWLYAATKSHCEGFAIRTGRSCQNIDIALDRFFGKN